MINVTCAIIRNEDNEVLVVQRGELSDHPFKWEFPGGKLLPGETDEECVIREVAEELSMGIVIYAKLPDVEYDYGHKQIRLIPFICDTLDELPFLSEHIAYKWLSTEDLSSVDYSEADVFVSDNYIQWIGIRSKKTLPVTNEANESTYDAELQSMINRMIGMKEAEWIAISAIDNPAIFRKLLDFSFSDDKKLAFRASWTLTKVCDKYPEIILPFLPRIVESLNSIDNESAQRSFLRILSLNDLGKISKKHHGILADHCFNALKSGFSAIAIKAYSMEILYRLALIYPELTNELTATLNLLRNIESAGILARGRSILKKLAEIPVKPRSGNPI
jgi:8-oxo-dGTP diphosphatase